jgi:hypothetical protein
MKATGLRVPTWALGVVLAIVPAGCFDLAGLRALPGAGLGNAPGSPPDTEGQVSYSLDIQPIWDKNCVTCHRSGGIASTVFRVPMHLTSGQALDDLINKRSVKNRNWLLVKPGDPQASLLFRKVSDSRPPVGVRMPLFQPPLLDEEIELIREWIEQGASGE